MLTNGIAIAAFIALICLWIVLEVRNARRLYRIGIGIVLLVTITAALVLTHITVQVRDSKAGVHLGFAEESMIAAIENGSQDQVLVGLKEAVELQTSSPSLHDRVFDLHRIMNEVEFNSDDQE